MSSGPPSSSVSASVALGAGVVAQARPVAPESTGAPAAAPLDPAEVAEVRDAAAGDERAFAALVHRHGARVFGFLLQMTRHRQDAEDLAQRTFIQAHRGLGRFDTARPLINWLLTIARRSALNHFRDSRRWEEIPAEHQDGAASPARQAEERESADNLWARARRVLSQRDFEVLWLRFGEELGTEETARATGLSAANVKVIVFRARQQLSTTKGDRLHE